MPSQVRGPGSASQVSYGTVQWSNTARIRAEDSSSASASVSSGTQTTYRLVGTQFGFSIPSDATIVGIVARIRRRASAANAVRDATVTLWYNGAPIGDDKADTTNYWPTTLTSKTYGSSNDTWNASLTPAIVNSTSFGLAMAATITSSVAYVDYYELTVYYATVYPYDLTAGLYGVSGASLLSQTRRIQSLGSGSHLITGSTLLSQTRRMGLLQPGVYVVTVYLLDFWSGRIYDLAAGSYLLSGTELQSHTRRFVQLQPGVYVVTGYLLNFWKGRIYDLAAGSYALAGRSLLENVLRMDVLQPGDYMIIGSSLQEFAQRSWELMPGIYLVTGAAASELAKRLEALNPGAYVISGQSLQELVKRLNHLGPGSYATVGMNLFVVPRSGGKEVIVIVPGPNRTVVVPKISALAPEPDRSVIVPEGRTVKPGRRRDLS